MPVRARLLVLALLAALALPAVSAAASRNVVIEVVITNHSVVLGKYTDNQVADVADMSPLAGPLYRTDDVHFLVYNRSSKSQSFSVFGQSTGNIKPGGGAKFEKHPPRRGTFAYTSGSFHGTLTVK
ncbi:MAG: hypothetical protein JO186_11165 [Actinobacteria bacterium]|nr:hypothetical protein [Actinomycetota bacterium]MBV8598346.1 hypothetical protein [Actinomycetota bacterium]